MTNTSWDQTLETLKQQFSVDICTIHVLIPEENQLHLIAYSKVLPEEFVNRILKLTVGKGIAGTVVATKKPIVTSNLLSDAPPSAKPASKTIGVQGMITVPIFDNQGEILGALGLGSYQERQFSEQEINEITEAGEKLADRLMAEKEHYQEKTQ